MLFPDRNRTVKFASEQGKRAEQVQRSFWSIGKLNHQDLRPLLDKLVEASDVKNLFPEDSPYKHVNLYDDYGLGFHYEISLSQELLLKLSEQSILGQDNGKFGELSAIVDGYAQSYRDFSQVETFINQFFQDADPATFGRIEVVQDTEAPNLVQLQHFRKSDDLYANQRLYNELNSILGGKVRFNEAGIATLSTTGMDEATASLTELKAWIGSEVKGDSYQARLSNVKAALTRYDKETGPSLSQQLLSSAAKYIHNAFNRSVDAVRADFGGAALTTIGGLNIVTGLSSAAYIAADKMNFFAGDLLSRVQNITFPEVTPALQDPVFIAALGMSIAGGLSVKVGTDSVSKALQAQQDMSRPVHRGGRPLRANI